MDQRTPEQLINVRDFHLKSREELRSFPDREFTKHGGTKKAFIRFATETIQKYSRLARLAEQRPA